MIPTGQAIIRQSAAEALSKLKGRDTATRLEDALAELLQ